MRANKTRQSVLDHIKIAGYHSDYKSFMRLYTENRVSYKSAQEAFNAGIDSKKKGIKCSCCECSKQGLGE